jgi:hypothetical protein
MGSFLENCVTGTLFWANFFHNERNVFILAKKEEGQNLGEFFIKSSGHPDQDRQISN